MGDDKFTLLGLGEASVNENRMLRFRVVGTLGGDV